MAIMPFYPMMSGPLMLLLVLLVVWDMVWKGISLWKAGRNNQLEWFIALLIFNTAGILPIAYIAFFQKKSSAASTIAVKKKK